MLPPERSISTVELRELHNRTREVIVRVFESGEEITVTRCGLPVVLIVPVADGDPVERLRRMGALREAESVGRVLPPPIKLDDGAIVSDLICR